MAETPKDVNRLNYRRRRVDLEKGTREYVHIHIRQRRKKTLELSAELM